VVAPKSSDFELKAEAPEMTTVGGYSAALSAMEMVGKGPPLVVLVKSSHNRLDQGLQRIPLRPLAVVADGMKVHKSCVPVVDPVPRNEHFAAC
jgi:hypothetical protein